MGFAFIRTGRWGFRPIRIKRLLIRISLMSVLIGYWFFFPLQAGSYVLEGPHVLDKMVQNLSGAKSLRILQQVLIEDAALSDQPLELTETLSYIFPDRFRSDAWYQGTNRIFVAAFDQFLTVIDEKITSFEQTRFDRYKDPLLHNSRKSILKALLASGIDVGITSLGKMDSQIALIVGAQYPDRSVSQLWVDKDRFLPLRSILVQPGKSTSEPSERLEFVYRNWQKFDKFWYPMLIETYRNDILIRRIQVRNVMQNAEFSGQLLDIAYLLSIYKPSEPTSPAQPPKTDVDEVQRTIEDFKKKFEP